MAQLPDRKLYLGPRLRVLRRELGINQTQMAEELGISPSYLNHLERNQRPLTAPILLRLANTYDVDVRDFVTGAADPGQGAALAEAFADHVVRDIGVARNELLELTENYPGVVEAVVRLHRALADLRRTPDLVDHLAGAKSAASPVEWLGAYLGGKRNYFPSIEAEAEALTSGMAADPAQRAEQLRGLLHERFGITVAAMPSTTLVDALRHYDFHRRRLMLSERLPAASRAFAIAYQIAASAMTKTVEDQISDADPPEPSAAGLLKIALFNHAAAALLMPYGRFATAAEESRYDFALLQGRFGVSFEQAAHRLTTLDRSGARGIPFFLMRVDRAGNVSKRLVGAEGGAIARAGEGCPRWRLHAAMPGQPVMQLVEMPNGSRSVTVSTAVDGAGVEREGGPVVIVLGCDAKHMPRLAFADRLDPARATTVGPGCGLCDRAGCPDRALPPLARTLEPSSFQRPVSPFPFRKI